MTESNVNLSFSCPEKWSTLTPNGKGRFCTACKKTVTDFTGVAINALPEQISGANECGRFRAYQLHKPFNNWKDKIISGYQRVSLHLPVNKLSRSFVLLLLSVLLFVTGCTRHVMGKVRKPKTHRASSAVEVTSIETKN